MGIGLDDPAAWRGWEQDQGTARRVAAAARLGATGDDPGGRFPRTRAWIVLGSPLELLSPLAVLRVNYAFGALAFTLVGCLGARTWAAAVASVGVGLCTFVLWVVLLGLGEIAPNPCRLLSAYWTTAVAILVVVDRTAATAAVLGFLLVPSAVFVSLFFGLRVVTWQLGLAALALWLALSAGHAPVVGLLLALVAVAAMATAPLAVLLVARASRRSGLVDPETGLPNTLGLASGSGRTAERPTVVAAVTLSGVGECREALGHPAAAELLRRAVEHLGRIVPAGARIGRVGGDEVVVVDVSGTSAETLARMLVAAISSGRYLVDGLEVSLRAHVGLALAPRDGDRMADLVRRASLSAGRAARLGVPSASWDGDRDAMTVEDLTVLASLRAALGGRGLSLAYQPQFATATGTPVSVEALLRWDDPVRGRIPPDRFIGLAERTGLIDRLTRWTLSEALDAQVRWRAQGVDLPVSVNVSAKNLADPGLPGWVLEALDERQLPASSLTVEVTESAVTDPDQARAVLGPLRDHGVRISMDDFGTGFTSLSALPTLPLDELKIDQGFVRRSVASAADDAIVATMCDLGHRLGLTVVAEGVEDAALETRLVALGVDLLQGFHLARPLAEVDVLALCSARGMVAPGPLR
jgi:diguanylate cyclase